jgi:TolA-binding protein
LRIFAREAATAALLALGCAGGDASSRKDVEALRAEIEGLRHDNEDLARKVETLSGRLDVVAARLARPAAAPGPEPRTAAVVPPDLAVVKLAPGNGARREPPTVPTGVPIAEPDEAKLEGLARRSGREIAAEAQAELDRARRKAGLERAHALEDFAGRYPRHPFADNALVEAAQAYADAGKDDAACALARRVPDDYPAGDAVPDALERLAGCEGRRGAADAERRLLERLVHEYPRSPAAERAGKRLAASSGRPGDPPAGPARSGP